MTLRLHYVHDPLCGWCYAAAPLVAAATAAGIPVVLHGGGLFPEPMPVAPDKRQYIRAADGRIAEMTGQRFGAAYLDGRLPDPSFTLHSLPPLAAVLAAEEMRAGAGLEMLGAIQIAHYGDGRRVIEPATLQMLAAGLGLSEADFSAAMARQPVAAHVMQTRQLMARYGLGGFPGFLVELEGQWQVVPHAPFYGQPEAFLASLPGR